MKQKNLARFYLLLFGGIFFLTSCAQLIRFYYQRDDIWWTPVTSPLSLEQSRERVEVYVRGVRLQNALQSGHLQMVGDSGPTSITASDIGIRLNNNDRVRVERLPSMLASAAGAGATGFLLLLGLVGWVPSRPRKSGA
jgi:hypothetical protein